jgi:hypothetical protein
MSNKQTFLNYCNEMMRLALPLFDSEMDKHRLTKLELGQGIDFLGSPHPVGKKWLTEPYSIWAKTRNSKLGEDADAEIIQITICPAEDWKPILSVSTTSLDPITFETTDSAEKDLAVIRKKIEECFARFK